MKNKSYLFGLLGAAAVCGLAPPASAQVVYFNNFDSLATLGAGATGGLSGITTQVAVPSGYAGVGFSGQMLQNASGGTPQGTAGSATTLSLANLPAHTSINIDMLLAIIDSWDGENAQYGRDVFTIMLDGTTIYNPSFYNVPGNVQTFVPGGSIITLANDQDLGFTPGTGVYSDDAYSFSLLNIPHTAATLTISIFASGTGWQGGTDESWGADNLQISLNGGQVNGPEPATLGLLLVGGVGLAVVRRRNLKK